MIKHYYFVAFSLQSAWGQIEIGHLFLKTRAARQSANGYKHNKIRLIMGYRMKTKPASMRVQAQQPETQHRTCGECGRGCWNEWNLNYKGNRFYGYCEHATFAKTRDGRGLFLDNSPACGYFFEGVKQKGQPK